MTYLYSINFNDSPSIINKNGKIETKNPKISSFMVTKPEKNEDSFSQNPIEGPKKEIFTASDGRMYDINEYINQRLMASSYSYQNFINSNDENKRYIDLFKSAVGIKGNKEKMQVSLDKAQELLSSNKPLKDIFQELTGKEYNRKNLELLLRGELKIKAEKEVEEFTCKSIMQTPLTPIYNKNLFNKVSTKKTDLNKTDKEKYQTIIESLDISYRQKMEKALNSGKLLLKSSTNNSTVLDNLHKILVKNRVAGLDSIKIIKESLDILNNPFVITQTPGNIPDKYQTELINIIMQEQDMDLETAKAFLNNKNTGACAAATLEYKLATENTAEFFRMVEELTSEEYKTDKIVNYSSIADNRDSAIELLKKNNTEYKNINENLIKVTLRPDKNAIIRARIQNYYHDIGERSIIDVLVQSTIMNFGSKGTYDGLSDTRKSSETYPGNGGLGSDEVAYTSLILTNGQSEIKTYQNINTKEWKLENRNLSIDETKKHILQLLENGKNVIIGMSMADENNNIMGGHETTIIGYTQNLNGDKFFILQDSDDNQEAPLMVSEDMLLSNIQHSIYKK